MTAIRSLYLKGIAATFLNIKQDFTLGDSVSCTGECKEIFLIQLVIVINSRLFLRYIKFHVCFQSRCKQKFGGRFVSFYKQTSLEVFNGTVYLFFCDKVFYSLESLGRVTSRRSLCSGARFSGYSHFSAVIRSFSIDGLDLELLGLV